MMLATEIIGMGMTMNGQYGRRATSRAGKASRNAWLRHWRVFALLLAASAVLAVWLLVQGGDDMRDGKRPSLASLAPDGSATASLGVQDQRQISNGARLTPIAAKAGMTTIPKGFMRAPSGKLLPRFVSLAREGVQLRVGPSPDYPVAWILRLKGVPLEVTAEAGAWWRVRDHEGEEGWLHASVLDDRRSALVAPWNRGNALPLRQRPAEDAPVRALVRSGVIAWPLTCDGQWCQVRVADVRGWLPQQQLWGVYAGERF